MSQRKGNAKKKGQKYQNTVAFNPQKWGTSEKTISIQNTPIGAVCTRCSEKLEWKKKYNKYKPLRVPASCECCKQKSVKHTYHKYCLACAAEKMVCAMCKTKGEVIDLPPSRVDELRLAQIREVELKNMKERDRRTLLRKMEREANGAGDDTTADDAAAAEVAIGEMAIGDVAHGAASGDADDTEDHGERTAQQPEHAAAAAAPAVDDLDWEAEVSGDEET